MDIFDKCISLTIELKVFGLLIVLISSIAYVYYKLTFWERCGIPNDIFHTYKSFSNILQLNDWNCIKKNGKIVG